MESVNTTPQEDQGQQSSEQTPQQEAPQPEHSTRAEEEAVLSSSSPTRRPPSRREPPRPPVIPEPSGLREGITPPRRAADPPSMPLPRRGALPLPSVHLRAMQMLSLSGVVIILFVCAAFAELSLSLTLTHLVELDKYGETTKLT